jgi:hypothetical protein
MLIRKFPKSAIVSGIVLVVVVLGFVIWNGSAGSNEETSATPTTTPTTPATTTTIPQVSFATVQAGGTGLDSGLDGAVTSDGGAVVTGAFVGTATFGSTILTSSGDRDVFVGKISSAGVWVWVTQAGGTGGDFGTAVAVTADGGAIITGAFVGTATFGSTTLTSSADADVFVAKISSNGAWVWATQTGGTGYHVGADVAATADGGAIITGEFADTASFGSTTLTSNGFSDVFVGKVSSAGAWVWAIGVGGTGEDYGRGAAVTVDGGAIVTGGFPGTATFGLTTLISNGSVDVFVGKISSAGAWVWVTQTGGTGFGISYGVAVVSDGGAIVTGQFDETASFGSTTLTSNADADVFVAKISSAGAWVWATQTGGTGYHAGGGVGVSSDGGAIVTGQFDETASFGSTTLTSNGDSDVFVGKMSSVGVWEWTTQIGDTGDDWDGGVAVTVDGGAIVVGNFVGSATLGSTTLTSNGYRDVFVAKISSAGIWNS